MFSRITSNTKNSETRSHTNEKTRQRKVEKPDFWKKKEGEKKKEKKRTKTLFERGHP